MSTNKTDEIRNTIYNVFDNCTSRLKTDEYQAACLNNPQLDEVFEQEIENIFLNILPNANVISNLFHDSTGRASYILAYVDAYKVSCYLLICHFYPVATLRVAPDWMIVEGFSNQWDLNPDDKERWALIRELVDMNDIEIMNTSMLHIENDIKEVLSCYGYSYLPWNSAGLNQEIKFGFQECNAWDYLFYLFSQKYNAWDYLFYLGVPCS